MKRRILLGTATAVLVAGTIWGTGVGASAAGRIIEVHAAASAENFVDAAPAGISLGDQIVVHDHLRNSEGHPVGHDGVACTVTFVRSNGDIEFECLVTARLGAGTLTAQGFFVEPARTPHHPTAVLAVTGGTGAFAGATGTVHVHEVSEEESDYTFFLAS